MKYPETRHEHVWWAPDRASWWIGVLFAIGSTCFLVGPVPGFVELVGSTVDGLVFFVGSIFFTSAAALQYVESGFFRPRMLDWWSSAVQLVGTVFFNISTFHALQAGLDATEYNRLVWTPDARGSICFLVSGCLAYVEVRGGQRTRTWWIAAVNLAGCAAFGISAVASHVVPSTGSARDLARANLFTALGALGFLIGALLLMPKGANDASPASDDANHSRNREPRVTQKPRSPR
ncbi:MAG TPA: hypothetical protein VF232_09320 [Gaiellaceae bacterium]